MQKITPFLWYDTEAEAAAKHYVSIFKNSRIKNVTHYGDGMPMPAGSVMTVDFVLDGLDFVAMNGGPQYPFTHAVSFSVGCETQAELDEIWDRLAEGGSPVQCGWLKDRYGLSWQIVPSILGRLTAAGNPKKTAAMMQALVAMVKLDIAALQQAYDNG